MTQLAHLTTGALLKHAYESPNPTLNVMHHGEPVATNTLSSNTPAANCGVTQAQNFVSCNMDVVDVYPLQTKKQFINTLEDNVRFRGAKSKIISDCAQVEILKRIQMWGELCQLRF